MRDQRGIISGFIIRLVIFFVVLLAALNEIGQLVITQIQASNAASAAAAAGADSFKSTRNSAVARAAAVEAARESHPGTRVILFAIAADGSATVTVAETANTLIIRRVSFLRRFGIQHSTQDSAPPS